MYNIYKCEYTKKCKVQFCAYKYGILREHINVRGFTHYSGMFIRTCDYPSKSHKNLIRLFRDGERVFENGESTHFDRIPTMHEVRYVSGTSTTGYSTEADYYGDSWAFGNNT